MDLSSKFSKMEISHPKKGFQEAFDISDLNNDCLITIINKLDVKAFLRLSATNSGMFNFMANRKGIRQHAVVEAKVLVQENSLRFSAFGTGYFKNGEELKIDLKSEEEIHEILPKFNVHFKTFVIRGYMKENDLQIIEEFLKQIPRWSIESLDVSGDVYCWKEMLNFVKKHDVSAVSFDTSPIQTYLAKPLFRGKSHPTLNKIHHWKHLISKEAVAFSSIPHLSVTVDISLFLLKEVLKHWIKTPSLKSWTLRTLGDGVVGEMLRSERFFLPFNFQGPISNERPLYVKGMVTNVFFVLCEDNRIFCVSQPKWTIQFQLITEAFPFAKIPNVLKPFVFMRNMQK